MTTLKLYQIVILSVVCVLQTHAQEPVSVGKIPENLNHVYESLNKMLPDTLKKQLCQIPEATFVAQADSDWRYQLQRLWRLQTGSELSYYFNDLGIDRPADMIQISFTTLHRMQCGQPVQLVEQINQRRKENDQNTLTFKLSERKLLRYTHRSSLPDTLQHWLSFSAGGASVQNKALNEQLNANGFPQTYLINVQIGGGYTLQYKRLLTLVELRYLGNSIENEYFSVQSNTLAVSAGLGFEALRLPRFVLQPTVMYTAGNMSNIIESIEGEKFDMNGYSVSKVKTNEVVDYLSFSLMGLYEPFDSKHLRMGVNLGYMQPVSMSRQVKGSPYFPKPLDSRYQGIFVEFKFMISLARTLTD